MLLVKRFCGSMFCLTMVLFASLFVVSGCVSSHSSLTSEDQRLRTTGDAILAVRRESPDLAAFKETGALAAAAFTNRSDSDKQLLAGRLYYDARQRSSAQGDAVDAASIRKALGESRSSDRFSRAYFDGLLSDTRSRAREDAAYAEAIDRASNLARRFWNSDWDNYSCYVDGFPEPIWVCRSLLMRIWVFD